MSPDSEPIDAEISEAALRIGAQLVPSVAERAHSLVALAQSLSWPSFALLYESSSADGGAHLTRTTLELLAENASLSDAPVYSVRRLDERAGEDFTRVLKATMSHGERRFVLLTPARAVASLLAQVLLLDLLIGCSKF